MVKPPGETTFHKKFPLFTELLRESENTHCRKEEKCPATAPVLSERYRNDRKDTLTLTKYGDRNRMEKETEESKSGEDVTTPIVLQDPPKCKLKRQLSIDTVERSEALRIHKKAASSSMKESAEGMFRPQDDEVKQKNIGKAKSNFEFKDEVDGSSPSSSVRTSRHIDRLDSGIDSDESVSRSRRNVRRPLTSEDDVTSHCAPYTKVPHIYCSPTSDEHAPYDNPPLLSPNRFNLNDIGLTSPFMNITQRGAKGEDEVFLFPDSVAHRKVSPYKGSPCKGESAGDVLEREISERCSRSNRSTNRLGYEREVDTLEKSRKRTGERDRERDQYGAYPDLENENRAGYVTHKGFVWPKTVTVTEPVPLSPRIVTASPKSRNSSTTSASASKPADRYEYDDDYDEEKLRMKLRMLERAHAHAKEIYGSPPATRGYEVSDLSPKSRQGRDIAGRATLKSISCVDRSPNEKDILETTEEVRKYYERSISDPRFSPSQLRSVVQKPSPLARDLPNSRVGESIPDSGPPDRCHSPLRDDVRRRLFRKGYQDYDRQTSYPDRRISPSSHVTTDIPPEVLQFLQSRNFHPEELENLKDILRRGGTPPLSSSPTKSFSYNMTSQSHYNDVTGEYSSYYGQGLLACADGSERPRGPLRERRLGEIDVHVTCEKISEKTNKVQEILRELDHDDRHCKCGKIEEEIKSMAINAYSKILRADRGREAYEQFQREKAETDAMVYDSMKNLCGIKCLCKYGRTLEDVYSGSVVFRLHCPTLDALLDLWHTYRVGDLGGQIQDAFVTRGLLDRQGCDTIELRVRIAWKEFVQCKEELELQAENAANRTPTKQITVIHARSRSEPASVTKQANQIRVSKGPMSPFRERMCSDSSVELSPRRAFQEINCGKFPIHPPPSASRKFFPEVILDATDSVADTGSAKSPPNSPTSERENVELQV